MRTDNVNGDHGDWPSGEEAGTFVVAWSMRLIMRSDHP